MKVSIIGSGTMGVGIAQIAATKGHQVVLYDAFSTALENAKNKLKKILDRLVEKERITKKESEEILQRIHFTDKIKSIKESELVIEAVIEDLDVKKKIFVEIESIVDEKCIIGSNFIIINCLYSIIM